MLMGAKAATAREHRRCFRCGTTDSSAFTPKGTYCKSCVRMYNEAHYRYFRKRPVAWRVYLFCPECGRLFVKKKADYKRHTKQSKSGALYCSKRCSGGARSREGNALALSAFRRRRGWSDERWKWERRLVELSLGMERGRRKWLEYGYEPLSVWK